MSFTVTPNQFVFSVAVGDPDPPPQVCVATSSPTGQAFTVVSNQTWLTAVPNAGTTPANINVTISLTGLGQGVYSGTLTFKQGGLSVGTATVTLGIYGGGPEWGCGAFSAYNQPAVVKIPEDSTTFLFTSQNDITGGNGNYATCYDNFTLGSTKHIAGVHWVGGYFDPARIASIVLWTVTFWTDNAGEPGTRIQDFVITGNASEVFIGEAGPDSAGVLDPIFSYKAPVSFTATGGVKYWLSVIPNVGFPPEWGWCLASSGDGHAYQDFFGFRSDLLLDLAFGLCLDSPCLSLSTSTLTFTGCALGPAPTQQTVDVTNGCTGDIEPFTVAVDEAWLVVSPLSGNTPATLDVNIDITGLGPGTFTGHITVTADSITGSPAVVTVTLTLTQNQLASTPASLGFVATLNGPNPAPQHLTITNAHDSTVLSFTDSVDEAWLAASPASDSTPSYMTVSVDVTGLDVGTYTGHITFVTSCAIDLIVPVTLIIEQSEDVYFELQKLVVTVKQDSIPVRGRNK